ncbi:MAG: DoxX family protein [Bacteroidales bacterium]|jgi:uncharacterized membrane protein YphA (DoxX/SURF4 family)|nr:DoxX family protein [Bacteroidales bacterium]
MKTVNHISRILLGITFIFSGFVKGIDPWGSAYKFTDYFNAMGIEWLTWAAFSLGILLSLAEFTIGVALLFNIFLRLFSSLALIFMAFFLPLTLWIAIKNPVTDCGCFGDALIISNWGTFYKNIVLGVFAIIVFVSCKIITSILNTKFNKLLGGTFVIIYMFLVYYSYNHLPVLDFRPYKIGANIPESMTIPDDAKKDIYENIFYYKNKNTGEIREFSEDNYPWQDTVNWEFSDIKSSLVEKGYEPPIHDFTIETSEGVDIADNFLSDENFVFILVSHDLRQSSLKPQERINELANWALQNDLSFICLTSTMLEESLEFASINEVPYEFFNCDEITLKTIIRSNPGLIVIKNGTVLGKWHYNDIPSPEEFQNKYINEELL